MECIVLERPFSPKFMLKFEILMINHYKLRFHYLQIKCIVYFGIFCFCFLFHTLLHTPIGCVRTVKCILLLITLILFHCFFILNYARNGLKTVSISQLCKITAFEFGFRVCECLCVINVP